MAIPKHPSMFVRFPGSQVGHEAPTLAPFLSEMYDYEAELAVVIGRTARHVTVKDALEYVLGYT